MIIILADSELELVPDFMKDEEDVKHILRREGKADILLDDAVMRKSIQKFFPQEAGRIGFPYIAYMFFRLNEETLLNDRIDLDYAIHTKNHTIIERKDFRNCGLSYCEFAAFVEERLRRGKGSKGLIGYLEEKGILGHTAVLHPKGRREIVVNDQANFIIGGFPNGDFRSNLENLRKFSLYEREITVPAVLELLHFRLFLQSAPS